ncbi:MAG: FAD-dependent oxidoreductase [Acidimicrobiales bacterium]
MAVERADVAVIGAGPAGSVAALVLARAGARVALVDKAAFPRDKACGDLVGPRGVRVL